MRTVAEIKTVSAVSIYFAYLAKPIFDDFRINIRQHSGIIFEAVKGAPGILGMITVDPGTQTVDAVTAVIVQCDPEKNPDPVPSGCGDRRFRRIEPAEKFHGLPPVFIAGEIEPIRRI
ncbi:MAG: hypothetical protein IJS01_11660 [Lentisphaeria bacterium]|nr:hypothetical protein [Lentisphaeria bacterium]